MFEKTNIHQAFYMLLFSHLHSFQKNYNLRGYDWLNHSWESHPLAFYAGSLNVQKYHCPYLWSWQIENHSIL
ncbi:hypothetical protein E0F51_01125 [Streptococcus pyogenes]|uniref:Uncharacterized protein n=1 Tax=Streptococcus pyogenes serotype M12 (strain MGAS9429) TaxID=370551 RepID=Q1JLV1_STRPC|nr:hypothetical protein M28_Spy0789 [Streptococcus pyogenes MGAS6180]AAZ51430.1 hypothetical protein M5005_Spy0812 [Streptococcus pyogenes MGAS5005]ABF32118.1 hypothetical protein MGAS9429_Spy0931 [Streptococcus pyogenes MGAS9429]ABF35938.1 hypothetical protein MGAS2096_Spy0886 [Streptococcus pyogenes MGAS2096]AIW11791.1 hypothetical protein STAB904_05085 [Streptococcus pyogenes]BAN59896.1 hypothetical protein M1GAS476_1936 [Streptococcus pyogenes M1 476]